MIEMFWEAIPPIVLGHLGLSVVWAGAVYGLARVLAPVIGAGHASAAYWQWTLICAAAPALLGLAGVLVAGFGFAPSAPVDLGFYAGDMTPLPPLPQIMETSGGGPLKVVEWSIKMLTMAYAAGVCLWGLRFALAVVRLRLIVKNAVPLTQETQAAGLGYVLDRTVPGRTVEILVTDASVSAFVLERVWDPARLVLPRQALDRLSADQIALITAHEAVHLARRDGVRLMAFHVLTGLFWFNPFILALAGRARLAIELVCDERVLGAVQDQRRIYAEALVQSFRISSGLGGLQPVAHFTSPAFRSEKMRLFHILSKTTGPRLSPVRAAITGIAALAVTGAVGLAHVALAAAPDGEGVFSATVLSGRLTASFGHYGGTGPLAGRPHHGVDVAAPTGTPIHAPAGGVVTDAADFYRHVNWGKGVAIDHGNGWVTRYAHLDGYTVRAGQRVAAGTVIGFVGNTGKSTGPHLHVEVLKDGKRVDPMSSLIFDLTSEKK